MARMSPNARSVFAIADGLLLFFALQGMFYAIALLGLNKSFDTPTRLYLASNALWAFVSALSSGFAAGRVARRHPLAHGVALAVPFLLLSLFNLNKGFGGRHTLFVVCINVLVPLGFILGAFFAENRRKTAERVRAA